MKKICVIFGGISVEHEVSRVSASNVLKNLDKSKFEPVVIEFSKTSEFRLYEFSDTSEFYDDIVNVSNNLEKKRIIPSLDIFKKLDVDVVFPIIHGSKGEDGVLQGFLELCDVAYVGCDVLSSAVCMDKILSKDILVRNGIAVANYVWFTCDEINDSVERVIKSIESDFSYPVFIKPSECGSSVGINKAKDKKELEYALKHAALFSRKILVEEFVRGMELEVAVLGSYSNTLVSDAGHIMPSNEFYDYAAKYIDNKSVTELNPDIPASCAREIRSIAQRAFSMLGCYGMARVDFFLTNGKKAIVNEVNTIPGFTGISMYPKLMGKAGMPYPELLERLIELASERKEKYIFKTDYTGVEHDGK